MFNNGCGRLCNVGAFKKEKTEVMEYVADKSVNSLIKPIELMLSWSINVHLGGKSV
jgi:hypothetical protein